MKTVVKKAVLAVSLIGASAAALAGEPKPANPHEPVGFITGAVIGAFAAGPIGGLVGAGLGTWLGNRVHRAGDANKAEARVAALQTEKSTLQTEKLQLTESNLGLTAKLEDLSGSVQAVQATKLDPTEILDGLQGDVLFRTGSAQITPEIAHQVQVLAQAVAKSPAVKVRVDGYADPRGTVGTNLVLSEERANAVRDLLLEAGVSVDALEVNAYGDSQSVADDNDGYALERRVRLTLHAQGDAAVAQVGQKE